MAGLDRRTFLLGAAGFTAAGTVLAACGDDGSDTALPGGADPLATPLLVPSFPDGLAAPSPFVHSAEQRVAYVLHDGNDVLRDGAPATVDLAVFDESGARISGGEATRRDQGRDSSPLATPYYAVTFVPPVAGRYRTVLTNDAGTSEHEFLVLEPGETTIPQPGDALPAIHTPTFTDARGVAPICTRLEPCPFHDVDLVDALASGRPTVLSIATPGFCQTAICGPVVDLLIEAAADRDDLQVIHAEVYVDPENDDGIAGGAGGELTEVVDAYGLPYEPVLYVVGADGVVRRRLDAIYDGSELAEALALV